MFILLFAATARSVIQGKEYCGWNESNQSIQPRQQGMYKVQHLIPT